MSKLESFIDIANEIMYRSRILCYLYTTKNGILRIMDDEFKVVIRHSENKIVSNKNAIEWVMDALTVNGDDCYPRSSIEETQSLQNLARYLLSKDGVLE